MPSSKRKNKGSPLRSLIIYWSATGNTEKVAETIQESLGQENVAITLLKVADADKEDLYAYDLVFLGAPPYQFLPPEPVIRFVKEKMRFYSERGDIKLGAPKRPGKRAVVFCTYSGPHTGVNEAIPVVKYLGQFLEHLGFEVVGEWYTVGEFHNREDNSTRGRLGDIRGRPNQQDLALVKKNVSGLIRNISKG
ncbi:MAG: flavodoxin domain-containing protein [Chloroflexota bacterium]